MMPVKETKEEAEKIIRQVLANDGYSNNDMFQASVNLKKLFKHPDKIFSRLKLEFVLQSAQVSVKNKIHGRELLVDYWKCLVKYFGKEIILDSKLFHHTKFILTKLLLEHNDVLDDLVIPLSDKFESGMVFQEDVILNLMKEIIEIVVLNWIDIEGSPHLALVAKISAGSPKLFQTVASVLCEALMRTQGHERVLEVTNLFIQSVKHVCLREQRDFLKLYPKSYCQIVSLLLVSPEIYSERRKNIVREVVSLLFEMFLTDRQKTFLLLSHYSKWVSDFRACMCNCTFYYSP